VSDSERAQIVFQDLKNLGVMIALDDFGTGYSSLSYLRRFPMRILKIDRSFVNAMDTQEGMTLLRAIVAMARSLGLSLVAEGIEHEDQARELRQLGCDEGQGFLYWRPMAAGGIDELLANANTPSGEDAVVQAPALVSPTNWR
jgi:Amt family ammonium transporter